MLTLQTLVTNQRDGDGFEHFVSQLVSAIEHFTVVVAPFKQSRNAQQTRRFHTEQGHNYFLDQPLLAICGFFNDYQVTTDSLQGLRKKNGTRLGVVKTNPMYMPFVKNMCIIALCKKRRVADCLASRIGGARGQASL